MAIQCAVWLKCNRLEYNYGRASLIYHWLQLVGPAGPANCSFLLAAQFSCQFLPNFPNANYSQYPRPPSLLLNSIPPFHPPWLLTLLGPGMRHLTGPPLIGLRWIIVHLWPDEMGLGALPRLPSPFSSTLPFWSIFIIRSVKISLSFHNYDRFCSLHPPCKNLYHARLSL